MKGSPSVNKLLLVFCSLLSMSCATFTNRKVSRPDVPQSVYQIKSDIEVDPSSLCDDVTPSDGQTPEDAKNACLQGLHERIGGNTYHFRFIGTAWIVGSSLNHAQAMTAGHVCETRKTYEYKTYRLTIDENGFGIKELVYQFPIVGVDYDLVASDNTVFHGLTVQRDDDERDVCVLTSPSDDLGPPLPVADSDPEYGDHCYYVGAPGGIWGNGLAMTVDLVYSGRMTPSGLPEMLAFSGNSIGGASGSPIICDGRVVGVLDRSARAYFPFTLAADWEDIHDVLKKGSHREKR